MISSISELLARTARDYPDTTAVVTQSREISYLKLHQEVKNRAISINRSIGVQSRVVALEGKLSIEYVTTLLAIMGAGHVAAPLNMRFPAQARAKQALAHGAIRIDEMGIPNGVSSADLISLPEQIRTLNPAVIIHTSGSSGEPKAAILSHHNLIASARGVNDRLSCVHADRWLCPLPLWHVGGLGILVRCLTVGATMLLADSNTLEEIILNYQPTHLSLVDTQLKYLLDNSRLMASLVASTKAILLGGSAISASRAQSACASGFPVFVSYGLTEMSSTVTIHQCQSSDFEKSGLTSGTVLSGRELRLSADNIIEVRGETRFLGYYASGTLKQPFDNNGWFSTGDRGMVDEAGELTVLGRRDNMFISGGENIQPEQIEALIRLQPEIAEAVVVPLPDSEFGFRPVAIVSISEGSDFVEVRHRSREFLRAHLPGYMIPKDWLPWPDRANDAGGLKVDRGRMRAYASQSLRG